MQNMDTARSIILNAEGRARLERKHGGPVPVFIYVALEATSCLGFGRLGRQAPVYSLERPPHIQVEQAVR